MKKYSNYKDSEIEWIGEIPEDWEVKKIKQVSKIETGNTPPKSDEENYEGGIYLWVKPDELNGLEPIRETKEKLSEKGKQFSRVVPEGSVLVCGIGTIGKIGVAGTELSTNQQINTVVFINEKFESSYGKYLMSSLEPEFWRRSNKVVVSILNKTKQGDIKIPLPSNPEQIQIADFLDDKTEKINKVIENKKKQVDLLKEQKKITITTVTHQGFNNKIKDSKNRWLGNISSTWSTKKLKYTALVKFSNVDKKTNDDEIPVLLCNYVDVYKNEFINNTITFMKATAKKSTINRFSITKGDILVTKDSETPEDIAVPAYVNEEMENVLCGYHLTLITTKENLIGKYLFRLFESDMFNSQFEYRANGITRYGLSTHAFNNALIPIPPKEEQLEIIEYLDNYSKNISGSINTIQQEINKLEEYKKILINDCVTGKMKVTA